MKQNPQSLHSYTKNLPFPAVFAGLCLGFGRGHKNLGRELSPSPTVAGLPRRNLGERYCPTSHQFINDWSLCGGRFSTKTRFFPSYVKFTAPLFYLQILFSQLLSKFWGSTLRCDTWFSTTLMIAWSIRSQNEGRWLKSSMVGSGRPTHILVFFLGYKEHAHTTKTTHHSSSSRKWKKTLYSSLIILSLFTSQRRCVRPEFPGGFCCVFLQPPDPALYYLVIGVTSTEDDVSTREGHREEVLKVFLTKYICRYHDPSARNYYSSKLVQLEISPVPGAPDTWPWAAQNFPQVGDFTKLTPFRKRTSSFSTEQPGWSHSTRLEEERRRLAWPGPEKLSNPSGLSKISFHH